MLQKFLNRLRRPQVWGFFVSMAVMAVISLAFFAPDNFEGNSLQQADMRQGEANGHEAQVYQELTGEKALWTGALFSGMPTFQISPTYPSNSLFTWLNTVYGLFLPSPSNLLYMMMFGFFIMLCCLKVKWQYGLIGAIAWGFSSYFTILIGAGHIWKYLALTFIPPTIGGMVLAYRGRYVAGAALTSLFAMLQLNANHPQMSYYFAFVMFGLAIAYLIVDVQQRKVKQWVIASVAVLVSGILAVGANLPSLYNTYEYSKETKRAQSELTAVSDDTAEEAPAERPTGGLPKQDIVNWSYGTDELFTLLIPNVKGGASALPQKGQMQLLGLDRLNDASAVDDDIRPLLGYFTQYFNDSEGTNGPVYVGCIILALFILGCIICRGPMKWTLIVLTILSCLLALGRNFSSLTDLMIYHFPLYSKFRAVESILVISEFTIPLLSILALVKYLNADNDTDPKSDLRALAIAFGLPMAVCLIGILWPGVFGAAVTSSDRALLAQVMEQSPDAALRLQTAVEDLRLGLVHADCVRSFFLLLLAGVILGAFKLKKMPTTWTAALIGVLVFFDLYPLSKRYVNHDSFVATDYYTANYYDPFAPDAIDASILADTTMSYRVMDIPAFGDAARSYHHKMIGGYHAAKLNRYEDLIQRRMQYVQHFGYMPELRSDSVAAQFSPEEQQVIAQLCADYRVLDMLNAKYIITGNEAAPVLINPHAMGNAWITNKITYVDNADAEMAALSTLDPTEESVADKKFANVLGEGVTGEPDDTIFLTHYSPNRLTYIADTRHGGIGVFSEVWFPWGWKAEIDGTPTSLGRVNYVLRALRLPPGRHTVAMTFAPDSIHYTVAVAYASIILIYLIVLFSLFNACFRTGQHSEQENPDTKDGLV